MWILADECRCLWRPEASDPLELELQVAVSYSVGLLGAQYQSSGKVSSALTC